MPGGASEVKELVKLIIQGPPGIGCRSQQIAVVGENQTELSANIGQQVRMGMVRNTF